MIDVRLWFSKQAQAIYISHLDLNRCMLRALSGSGINIWYTEGFNPHPFVTFALPIPLGVESKMESMDIRLFEQPDMTIIERLNKYLPKGIQVHDITSPVMKPRDIAFAAFDINVDVKKTDVEDFLLQDSIIITKKSKRKSREIDIKNHIENISIKCNKASTSISVMLPAGSLFNVNPYLIVDALKTYVHTGFAYEIVKQGLFTKDKTLWK